MNNQAKLGMIAGILLLGFILIGAVSASLLVTTSTNSSTVDLNTITNEVVDELCSYLQIKQVVGKYENLQGKQQIQKIAILIKPLVSQQMNLSRMTLELSNGNQLTIAPYNGRAESLHSQSVFGHPLWDLTPAGTYSLLSTIDDDNSLAKWGLINKNTDMAFILLKLPEDLTMNINDQLTIILQPSPGQSRTLILESPPPIQSVVTLY
jgi:archaellin